MHQSSSRRRIARPLYAIVAACLVVASCESLTEVVATDVYEAGLRGSSVRPESVVTTGTGALTATLRSNTSAMIYDLTFNDLSAAATQVHLHGPAQDTVVAGVIVDFAALPSGATGTISLGTSGTASGSIDLDRAVTSGMSGDSLRKLLMLGLVYVDVHTGTHSGGEIRGQIGR